jgi:hypothetical protein
VAEPFPDQVAHSDSGTCRLDVGELLLPIAQLPLRVGLVLRGNVSAELQRSSSCRIGAGEYS